MPWESGQHIAASNTANEQRVLELGTRFYEAFNRHDLGAIANLLGDGLVWSQSGAPHDWNKSYSIGAVHRLFAQFPDLKLTTSSAWSAGDYVVLEGALTGTFEGQVEHGIPKTGKPIRSRALIVIHADTTGKVGTVRWFWDSATLAGQIASPQKFNPILCCIFCVHCCWPGDMKTMSVHTHDNHALPPPSLG
jgi:ketosteroid isomerase-like protein